MLKQTAKTVPIRKPGLFELKFLLVIIRKTFRSLSFISASLFGIALYIGLPLILLEAFEIYLQPSNVLYFTSLDVENISQQVANTLYGSIYLQVQVWSSIIRPIAIIAPTAILISKLIIEPYKSGQMLIYAGTPIKKSSMLLTSLGLALVITMSLIIIMEVMNIELSLQLFKSKLSPNTIEENFSVEALIRFRLGLQSDEPIPESILSSTSLTEYNAASVINYNNQVNKLIPGMIENVTSITRSSLPYSIGMLLFFGFLSMPISFLIGLKSDSRFSSLYSMFIISGTAIIYWGLVIPLSRLPIGDDVLLNVFTSLSYILIGIYPAYISASAFQLGGYNTSPIVRFSFSGRADFGLLQKKVQFREIGGAILDGSYKQTADLYLSTSYMLIIIGSLLFVLLIFAIWIWKKSDIK